MRIKLWGKIKKPLKTIYYLPKSLKAKVAWQKIEKDFLVFLAKLENDLAKNSNLIENSEVTKNGGLTKNKRNPKIIISLTSYPPRIHRIQYTIYSLLKQTVKPDEIILWLKEKEFPNHNADLPKTLLELTKCGLTIKYCAGKNTKSYAKLIPALTEYPNDIIVTVDDDAYYLPTMLELLLASYETNKNAIHAHRCHLITFDKNNLPCSYWDWKKEILFQNARPSFKIFSTNGGGTPYPPNSLHQDVFREDYFLELAPTADDIWFWAMAVLNDTKICVVRNNITSPLFPDSSRKTDPGLVAINLGDIRGQGGNDRQLQKALERYPVILEKLQSSEEEK